MASAFAKLVAGVSKLLNQPVDEADIDEFVSSEAVYRLTYDEDRSVLTVYFNSGSSYDYYDVPKSKATYFIDKAASKGRYLVNRVRNNYVYTRNF